ncbi:MAG: HAMP domain-containing protein [Myxococcales bacterium]|nr:HAMP domain-containing protein [Myxococcales bacterium]
MSLRLRLGLASAALVLVAVGVMSAILIAQSAAAFDREFEAELLVARRAVSERLERDAKVLRDRLVALGRDERLGEALRELTGDGGEARHDDALGPAKLGTAVLDAVLASSGLDTLWVFEVSGDGHGAAVPVPIGVAHTRGDAALPTGVARLARPTRAPYEVAQEEIRRSGRLVSVPVLEAAAEIAGGRIVLVGGRVMGRDVAKDLKAGATLPIDVALLDATGKIVTASFEGAAAVEPGGGPGGSVRTADVTLAGPGVPGVAAPLTIRVFASVAPLVSRRAGLIEATLIAGGVATALAFVFAMIFAQRLSRPLRALSAAARRIAAGERDVHLERRRDEVGDVNQAFEAMTTALAASESRLRQAERIAAWQDLARELAHEIKNPLTPIQMAVETLQRTWERRPERFGEIFKESTDTVLEEVERLKRIVAEFSSFARLPASERRRASLNDVVRRAAALFQETCDAPIRVELDPGADAAWIDPDRLAQLAQNLLKNAIEATRSAGRPPAITLRTSAGPDFLALEVEDNGVGIRSEDQSRVFTPYFSKSEGGTGLGLAVVSRVATEHGGDVEVQSEVGVGTRFVVRIARRGGEVSGERPTRPSR